MRKIGKAIFQNNTKCVHVVFGFETEITFKKKYCIQFRAIGRIGRQKLHILIFALAVLYLESMRILPPVTVRISFVDPFVFGPPGLGSIIICTDPDPPSIVKQK
jgi:hypothetical protein